MTRELGTGRTLRLRLLGAFVGVAAVAIAAFAGLTLWAGRGEVDDLVRRQQQATVASTVAAVVDAYRAAGGWSGADLRPARAIAVSGGALLEVRDRDGALVLQAGRGLGPGGRRGDGGAPSLDGGVRRCPRDRPSSSAGRRSARRASASRGTRCRRPSGSSATRSPGRPSTAS